MNDERREVPGWPGHTVTVNGRVFFARDGEEIQINHHPHRCGATPSSSGFVTLRDQHAADPSSPLKRSAAVRRVVAASWGRWRDGKIVVSVDGTDHLDALAWTTRWPGRLVAEALRSGELTAPREGHLTARVEGRLPVDVQVVPVSRAPDAWARLAARCGRERASQVP